MVIGVVSDIVVVAISIANIFSIPAPSGFSPKLTRGFLEVAEVQLFFPAKCPVVF